MKVFLCSTVIAVGLSLVAQLSVIAAVGVWLVIVGISFL